MVDGHTPNVCSLELELKENMVSRRGTSSGKKGNCFLKKGTCKHDFLTVTPRYPYLEVGFGVLRQK